MEKEGTFDPDMIQIITLHKDVIGKDKINSHWEINSRHAEVRMAATMKLSRHIRIMKPSEPPKNLLTPNSHS